MRIVDIFPYFNEKELLELRIKLLYDYVDQFIICEANRTHSGNKKEFTLKQELTRLNLFTDKIKVVELDFSKFDDDSSPSTNWIRERTQRNAASEYINEGDVCIVSDCDEIINPICINYYTNVAINNANKILRIPLINLCARADLWVDNGSLFSSGAFICLKHHLSSLTLSDIREKGTITFDDINIWATDNGKVNPAGWHFSWMGNSDRNILKNKSFAHCNDYIKESIYTYSDQTIDNFISTYVPFENNTDILGRKNHILRKYPIELLPKLIFELDDVKNFLLPNTLMSILEDNPALPTDKNILPNRTNNLNWKYDNYVHSYFTFYEKEFSKYQNRPISLCEIGIETGASIFIWNKYFHPKSNILGIDITNDKLQLEYDSSNFNNVYYLFGNAYNQQLVNILSNFDIIIDDGPHTIESQIDFIKLYLPKLNKGGILIIEDIAKLEYIEILKNYVPDMYKNNIEVIDLIEHDNRYDSLLFVVKK